MRTPALLLLLVPTGCFPVLHSKGLPWYDPAGLVAGAAPAPGKQAVLRTVLIDKPAGDPYLTAELWKQTDTAVPPEVAALLAENGLRVGRVAGNAPPEFLRLITSETATLRPMESRCPANEAKVVPVNGPVVKAQFDAWTDVGGKQTPYDLQNAEFAAAVTPKPGEPGRVTLSVEPRVQHANKQGWLRPNADLTGFAWADSKPVESFAKLTFEAGLGPQDYLIIGPTDSPVGKLGGAMFITDGDGRARMRVLVLRGWLGGESDPDPRRPTGAVAAQAGKSVARGQSR
jgi:acetyl esterase/lipase